MFGIGLWGLALSDLSAAEAQTFARQNPEKIVKATACGECHLSEMEVWKRTPHAQGFRSLHRKDSAEAIADKMGFRLIKRQSLCLRCHYTPTLEGGQERATSGVSCESCHGAAAEWIEVHNNYGPGNDKGTEPEAHRLARIEQSRSLGMRRPSDILPLVASCYGCHTVPEEKLVNVGGHSTGSGTFELVSWHEKIRHNFLQSFLAGDGTENAAPTAEHLRVLYVAGRALALEFGVRGMAAATAPGIYSQAMSRRVRIALSEVRAVTSRHPLAEMDAVVKAVRGVRMVPGNGAELEKVADEIRKATEGFLEGHDGTQLASLDGLVRGEEDSADEEDQLAEEDSSSDDPSPGDSASEGFEEGSSGEASGEAVLASSEGGEGSSGSSKASGSSAAGARPAASGGGVVGKRKRRIRPASNHRSLGPSSCSGCHGSQNGWWFGDRHFAAADPFFDREQKNVQIARLYGISPSEMLRGNQVCMDCHGSVVSGKEKREVQDGVGCESCHGPAADWLEPHQDEEGKDQGRNRPGYLAALKLGKRDLVDLNTRANTCTGCHYITEPRLLSAGHPSGKGFDYLGGMKKVKHWDRPLAPPAQLQPAFAAALSKRGGVPSVPVARLASGDAGASGSGGASSGGSAPGASETTAAGSGSAAGSGLGASPGAQFAGTSAADGSASGAGGLGAGASSDSGDAGSGVVPVSFLPSEGFSQEAFPEIGPDTTLEDLLLIIQNRIETLYANEGKQ